MSLNVHQRATPEDRRELRGYILRGLAAIAPRGQTERGIMLYLHTMQAMPTPEVFLQEIAYLRGRKLIRSEEHEDPMTREKFFRHFITPGGQEIANGEETDEHIG